MRSVPFRVDCRQRQQDVLGLNLFKQLSSEATIEDDEFFSSAVSPEPNTSILQIASDDAIWDNALSTLGMRIA